VNVLWLDIEGEATGLDTVLRAQAAGHKVRFFQPTHLSGDPLPYGIGLVDIIEDWESSMDWADLIVVNGNSKYESMLAPYFGRGYPIYGTHAKGAELELDRSKGQEILEACGVETAPYLVVDSVEEAISHIAKTGKAYALKPWGAADKALTYVGSSPDDAIYVLERWEHEGLFKGQLMLQEKVDGVEVGIAGYFGPGGWCEALEESFEHKKLMNDDLGVNTGEMGTVIRHVPKSKLFDRVLEPLTEYLQSINYVGDISVNCIVTDDGTPLPLEFTTRFGWPDQNIRLEVLRCDPVEWMLDLLQGKDTFRVSTQVSVGVVMAHGDFPRSRDADRLGTWAGYPISGITSDNQDHIHWQMVMTGQAPRLSKGEVKRTRRMLTAGNQVCVVTGSAKTVSAAAERAYETAWDIKWPSNRMFRTDIAKRLKDDLPKLQKHGFCEGMRY
jgi:phosphoribosylamine--glycine ligase